MSKFGIDHVIVIPKYPDSIFVEWSIAEIKSNQNYFFYIYVSDNPISGFQKVNSEPILNKFDYTFNYTLLTKQEYIYVKVEMRDGADSCVPVTFVTSLPIDTFMLINEIIRKSDLVRNEFTGIPCILRKRKIIGNPCIECIDNVTGMIINSHCLNCYGTKIEGGFSNPIELNCEIIEGERNIIPSEIGTIENIQAVGMFTFPLVFKGDILIEKYRNKIWYINSAARTIFRTYVVGQKIELRQLSPKDIEYSLKK